MKKSNNSERHNYNRGLGIRHLSILSCIWYCYKENSANEILKLILVFMHIFDMVHVYCNHPCEDGNARFSSIPFKALSDQV